MENLRIFQKFAKTNKNKLIQGNNAVIYTRVSTKEQAENNASLQTQKKYCDLFAERKELNVVKYFGGTYESAKSDERKEFQKMLKYVKSKNDISYIIVYSYDRFSRTGPNGAYISQELKKRGIITLSATQEVDATTSSGAFQQNMYYMFSQFDNEQRRDKIMSGMKEKLLKGYWINTVPFGYTNLNPGKGKIPNMVINKQGELLKLAFQWKLEKNMTYREIAERLEKKGLSIRWKKLSDYFRNPFYCGVIVHNVLDEPIIGKHPPLISRRKFAKINDLLYQNGKDYTKDDINLPLKRFIKAASCGTPYTGYLVKRKNLYYYKNNRRGSKENRSAKVMHQKFEALLKRFELKDKKHLEPLKEIMKYVFVYQHQEKLEELKVNEQKIVELQNKLEILEERFVFKEITDQQYYKFESKLKEELDSLKIQTSGSNFNLSNLEKSIDIALETSCNLHNTWVLGDLETKKALQMMVFPDGILFDHENDRYRTIRVNSFFHIIPVISRVLTKNENGTKLKKQALSRQVLKAGLEPARTLLSIGF